MPPPAAGGRAPGHELAGGVGVVYAAHELGPHQRALGHDAVHLHQLADEARRQGPRSHPAHQAQRVGLSVAMEKDLCAGVELVLCPSLPSSLLVSNS